MLDESKEVDQRAIRFATKQHITLCDRLGSGFDGSVYSTSRRSAIKVFEFARLYERARDVYLRLQEQHVTSLLGFEVPQFLSHDPELWVMSEFASIGIFLADVKPGNIEFDDRDNRHGNKV